MSDQFEDAVVRMLEDAAGVNRSVLAEARDSIAALPNRKVRPFSRLRRAVTGSLPRGHKYALAGAGAIVVVVMAVSVLGPLGRPAANSASPSTPAQRASASPSPSPSMSATSVPSAVRTGPAYDETLPVLLTAKHVAVAGWSPDGSKYALSGDATANSMLRVFDRSGVEVDALAGTMDEFGWLDADRFVVIAPEDQVNRSGPLGAFMGRVGSAQLTKLGEYDTLLAAPSGSIALLQDWTGDPALNMKPQYVVVSADGSVSKPRDGQPIGWSRDGSMLAVYHPTALAPVPSDVSPEPLGWLEIVRANGATVASTKKLSFGDPYAATFSPDGARVAFRYNVQPPNGTLQIAVLEVRTGHVTILPWWGSWTWANSDQLLFAYTSTDYGKTPSAIMAWSASTGRVTTYGPGDTVGASGLGTVIIGDDTSHEFTWKVSTAGVTESGAFSLGYSIGFGVTIPDYSWSPDGSSLILTVGDWNGGSLMDAVLFRPH